MKAISFCFEIIFFAKIQSNLAFHPGLVPGGEGSPLAAELDYDFNRYLLTAKQSHFSQEKTKSIFDRSLSEPKTILKKKEKKAPQGP